MGLTKTIEIDGKQVPFKASAAIPRIYRIKFHRDVYKDLAALEKAVGKNAEEVPEPLVKFLKYVHADLRQSTEDFGDAFVESLQASVRRIKENREMEERFMILHEMLFLY